MRWKLLIVAALVATIVGAGGTLSLILGLMGSSARGLRTNDVYGLFALIIPVLSISFASLFVYRHTARWRKTQALATALLSILLTLTVLIVASVLSARADRQSPPAPPPRDAA